MSTVRAGTTGILSEENAAKREEIVELLTQAYWMEIETVMNYIASSVNPDGVRAQEVVESLEKDIEEELGHARRFAERVKELYGVVPGSLDFKAEQQDLQPPDRQTDVVHVIRGVIAAESGAIEHYNRIIEATDGVDWVTQDMVIDILRDEEGHRRLFEGYLREYEAEGLALIDESGPDPGSGRLRDDAKGARPLDDVDHAFGRAAPPALAQSTIEPLLELPGRVELFDDVGTADQLSLDEDLRDRRPARDRRQLLTDPRVRKDVDRRDRCAQGAERFERAAGVPACDEARRALHEQHDRLRLDHVLDPVAKLVLAHLRTPSRRDSQFVDRPVRERLLQRSVDEPVLVDERKPVEGRSRDDDLEVIARPGPVEHRELAGVREGLPEQALETMGRHRNIMPVGKEAGSRYAAGAGAATSTARTSARSRSSSENGFRR